MSDCGTFDVGCKVGQAISGWESDLVNSITTGVTNMVQAVTTLWVTVPTPDLASGPGGTPSDPVAFVQGALGSYTFMLACASMAVGLARVAWEYSGHGRGRAVKDLGQALFTFLWVKGAGLSLIWLGTQAGDAFANWIIQYSTGKDFGSNLTAVLAFSSTATAGLSNFVVGMLALQAITASVGQLLAMIGRGIALVVLAGVWPTASSFRNLEQGEAWHRRIVAWVIAALVYKPAVAVIYATGFRMTSQHLFGTDGVITVVAGILLIIAAASSALALAKFAVPLVAAAEGKFGGSRGGSGAGAVLGAVAAGAPVVAGYVSSGHPGAGGSPSGSQPTTSGGPGPSPGAAANAATSTATGATTGGPAGATVGAGLALVSALHTATSDQERSA